MENKLPRVTLFTSNQRRHVSLATELAQVCSEVFVIQESATLFPGKKAGVVYDRTEAMEAYFSHVNAAERKYFGDPTFLPENVKSLSMAIGDLSHISKEILDPALHSDYYIVFGASFIKGWLIDFLVSKKCINLHLGISPYMRGASCNFWALYSGNYHLVGGTAHLITRGLDSGPMLWHAKPAADADFNSGFEFTMMAVVAMHRSLILHIKNGTLDKVLLSAALVQDKSKEVRYSRRSEFNDEVAQDFLSKATNVEDIRKGLRNQDKSLFLNLFELGNK